MSDASVEPGSDRRGSLTEGELMQVGALLRGGLSSILCTRSMQPQRFFDCLYVLVVLL